MRRFLLSSLSLSAFRHVLVAAQNDCPSEPLTEVITSLIDHPFVLVIDAASPTVFTVNDQITFTATAAISTRVTTTSTETAIRTTTGARVAVDAGLTGGAAGDTPGFVTTTSMLPPGAIPTTMTIPGSNGSPGIVVIGVPQQMTTITVDGSVPGTVTIPSIGTVPGTVIVTATGGIRPTPSSNPVQGFPIGTTTRSPTTTTGTAPTFDPNFTTRTVTGPVAGTTTIPGMNNGPGTVIVTVVPEATVTSFVTGPIAGTTTMPGMINAPGTVVVTVVPGSIVTSFTTGPVAGTTVIDGESDNPDTMVITLNPGPADPTFNPAPGDGVSTTPVDTAAPEVTRTPGPTVTSFTTGPVAGTSTIPADNTADGTLIITVVPSTTPGVDGIPGPSTTPADGATDAPNPPQTTPPPTVPDPTAPEDTPTTTAPQPVPTGACSRDQINTDCADGVDVSLYANLRPVVGLVNNLLTYVTGAGADNYLSLAPIDTGLSNSLSVPRVNRPLQLLPGLPVVPTLLDVFDVPDQIYAGIQIDPNNFTLVSQGYYLAEETGTYDFCAYADNIVSLYVGAGSAFACGDQTNTPRGVRPLLQVGANLDVNVGVDLNVPVVNVGVGVDANARVATCAQINLVQGYYYPLRLVYGQVSLPSELSVRVGLAGGDRVDPIGLGLLLPRICVAADVVT